MVKWLQVRKNWRDAANSNEKRYADSMKILTEMFELPLYVMCQLQANAQRLSTGATLRHNVG